MQTWYKKIHVKSSLEPKSNQYAMFIGRWQPLHEGHKSLFQQSLNEGKNIWIAIRNVETTESNPFNPTEVLDNIKDHYKELISEGRVMVSIVPDICSVEFGRGVGYDIIEHIPPSDISNISATKVREQLKKEGKL
jgi:nicotinamide mononucleotide adenylyltransferase